MIITDEKLLRVKCVDAFPEEITPIIEALESELKHSEKLGRSGIGLAAPQIGIAKNIAIIRVPTNNGSMYHVNLVNCRISAGFDQAFFPQEGCLSFPDQYVKTLRYQEIHVVDNAVEPHSFIATGLVAVCIQHELNHLEGILLPDIARL